MIDIHETSGISQLKIILSGNRASGTLTGTDVQISCNCAYYAPVHGGWGITH